ncbi:MAG: Mrp family chromosome partitioning ATPase [Verrucomicrobiales bacterium]|jgi:Mrp family chromosome partitioning ATPase
MNDDELELGHYGRIFRRSWWMIAVAVVATTLLAMFVLPAQENFYVSKVSVLLRPGDGDLGPPNDPVSEATEVGIAVSALIGDRVTGQYPSLDLETWRENLIVSACLDTGGLIGSRDCDSQILEMSYRGESPDLASGIVRSTADAYLDYRTEREVLLKDTRLTDLEGKFDVLALQSQLEQVILANAEDGSVEATLSELRLRSIENEKLDINRQLTTIETVPVDVGDLLGRATTPEADTSGLPRPFALLAGILMGLVLGGLAAILSDRLDRRVSSAAETEADLGVPVLGDIPRITEGSPALVTAVSAETEGAEAFRRLAAAALAPRNGFVVDSIAVTGANDNEGRTTASVNLALAIAQTGRKVLLIAADRRNDAIDRLFGLGGHPGLNQFLRTKADLEAARWALDLAQDRLGILILPTGSGPTMPLSSNGVAAILAVAQERNMVAVFDTPPALTHADGLQIAAVADAVYIIAAVGRTRRSELTELRVQLLNVQADVAGAILNRNSRLSLLPAGLGDIGTATIPSGVPGNGGNFENPLGARSPFEPVHTFGPMTDSDAPQASPTEDAEVVAEDIHAVSAPDKFDETA